MENENSQTIMNYLNRLKEMVRFASGEEDYFAIEYIAECFMCELRDVLANVKQEPRKEILGRCANNMGITVRKTDGILVVTLPTILPTKAKTKAGYLFDPIFYAMQNASEKESFLLKEKAMMCIEFIYDRSNKNIPRGDHDNKEVKQVIDAISAFVVPDDSDDYLSLCQISSEGDYNHTKVYVMPEKDFGEFFLKYQNK